MLAVSGRLCLLAGRLCLLAPIKLYYFQNGRQTLHCNMMIIRLIVGFLFLSLFFVQDRMLDIAAAKVASYCMLVLQGLAEKLHCLPSGIRWLVARLRHHVLQLRLIRHDKDVIPLLSDMVFGCYVCPAMVMPEAAIVAADTPVSDKARYNLTQVARVLQGVSSAAYSQDMPRFIQAVYDKIDLVSAEGWCALSLHLFLSLSSPLYLSLSPWN